jgi:uncharacterized protein
MVRGYRWTAGLMLALLAFAAGCSFLEPQKDPTRYYVLSPVADTPQRLTVNARLSFGPVMLPTYLDRPEILVSPAPHRLEARAYDRWAEPLPNAFPRVLKEDLVMLLGPDAVVDFGSVLPPRPTQDYILDVDVLRFEEIGHGRAALSARWTIKDARTRVAVLSRESNIERPVASSDTSAGVEALSQCIGELSTAIAQALVSLADQPR